VTRPDLPNITRRRKSLAAFLLGVTAATGVWLCTAPPGPGLDPDAASYLGAAVSLAHGGGYRVPVTPWPASDTTAPLAHFPPGYSTAIAVPVVFGLTATQGARVVNAVAAFAEIAIAVWLVADAVGLIAGVVLGVVLLVMHALVLVHLSVLSEPLFLAFLVAVLVSMRRVVIAPDEKSLIIAALGGGVAAAGAVLVRYAGVAAVGALVLWVVVRPARLGVRVRRAILAALPSILLLGAWVLHASHTSGAHSIRSFGAYGGMGETLRMGLSTVVGWLVPLTSDDTLPGRPWLALVLVLVLAFTTIRGAACAPRPVAATAIRAAMLLALAYLFVLVGSRWFADPGIPFDERLLVPLFLLIVIAAGVAIPFWWEGAPRRARWIGAILLAAWVGASFRATEDDVSWALENGQDFAQQQWVQSPVLAWARANAPRQPLYTNWPPAVLFHLHRAARELPEIADSTDAEVLRAFVDSVRVRHGVILAFDQPSPDFIGLDVLVRAPGLRPIARFADGTVLGPLPNDQPPR
jgi:hypothetical protein